MSITTRRTPNAAAPQRRSSPWRMLGPAFVAAVAYVDPGNIATNTAAGGKYGYALLWVVVLATAMAGPVQYLAAKLGTAGGASLPAMVARHSSGRVRRGYWLQGQLVAIATDVAEIIGAAVALKLLWNVPLAVGGALAAVSSTAILFLQDRLGPAVLQSISVASLVAIGSGFGYGLAHGVPSGGGVVGGLVPHLGNSEMVLLACGIVGATVMPHAVYLHSDLASRTSREPVGKRLQMARVDVVVAMIVAGTINVSMLLLGAASLYGTDVDDLSTVAGELAGRLGEGAATAFLLALLVSGLSSSAVGTQAGATISSGLLGIRTHPMVLRAITVVPALAILLSGIPAVQALVLSQVVLSLGLPFALVPLLIFTGRRSVVGAEVNGPLLRATASAIVALVVALDLALVALTIKDFL